MSDKTFLQDYNPRLSRYRITDPFQNRRRREAVSQLYLAGKGNRSYFDARTIYYLGFSEADAQSQIPVIHPVIDYNYIFDRPILGGELGYQIQLHQPDPQRQPTSIRSRKSRSTTARALHDRRSRGQERRQLPVARRSRHLQPLLGRDALAAQHHRPVRAGVHAVRFGARRCRRACRSTTTRAFPTYINTGDSNLVRAMPTVGLEYRYPFINVQSWGTQTIEPIAQIIARPNETPDRALAERRRAKP